jgi:sn-glycerol 3-phosphate transport system substrate-binding protein
MSKFSLLGVLAATTMLSTFVATDAFAEKQVKIEFWHAMGGALGETMDKMVADFNTSQDEYVVDAIFKGGYNDAYNAGIAAVRTGNPPAILQVLSWGAGGLIAADNVIKPVSEIMEEAGVEFDQNAFIPAVGAYYSDADGNLLSMPWNSSTPILFYNKAIFAEAGLDPEDPPDTWERMAAISKQIVSSGAAPCGFTIGWQFWVLENSGAWNDVELTTNGNGFGSVDSELQINKPFFVNMIDQISDWQEDGTFKYGGRRGKPDQLFATGECAMVLQSSAALGGLRRSVDFGIENIGQGFLPYWASQTDEPQNTIVGGATLWSFQGLTSEEYEAVANFFQYISSPEIQKQWHYDTGYVPTTKAAYSLAKDEGYYEENPGADIGIRQLLDNTPTARTRGHRLVALLQIGDIINNELEAVWAGDKTAQQAMDDAAKQANELNATMAASLN